MVRIPSFTRRSEPPAERDENGDGRIDARDDRIAADRADAAPEEKPAVGTARPSTAREQVDDRSTYRSRAATAADAVAAERAADSAEESAREARGARDVRELREDGRDGDTTVVERPVSPAPVAQPRARTSAVAVVGLVLAVASALAVLSGVLVAYGVALGAVALVVSLIGFAATGRRHVAGKGPALLGALIAAGALVVGVLGLSDALPWLTSDTDNATRLRDWLDDQWTSLF